MIQQTDPWAAQRAKAAAAGYSNEEINQFLQQRQVASRPAATTTKAAPAKKKKNFWLDQISTVGGIAGGIGGSFISPIAGTAAGAAGGSALGQAIEDAIMGYSAGDIAKDSLKEGAIGAVFGAGPMRLIKGGAYGASALARGAGYAGAKTVANKAALTPMLKLAGSGISGQAAKTAPSLTDAIVDVAAPTVQTAVKPVLKTSVTGKANTLGNKALYSQYGTVSKPVARQTKPLETIDALASYGITKPVDAERVSGAITGGNGILSKVVMNAVGKKGFVATDGIEETLQRAIAENGLVDVNAKSVQAVVNAQLKAIQQSGNNPNAIMKSIRALEARTANLNGKGGNYALPTPERVDQAKALTAVRNDLQDRLYSVTGADGNLATQLTPQVRQQLINLQPKNTKWAQYVDKNIMQAKDIKSLRSAQAPFVNMSKIINEGDVNAITFGGRVGNGAFNGGTVGSKLLDASTQVLRNPAVRAVSKPLRDVGSATIDDTVQGLSKKGIAGRLGTYGALTGMMNQEPQADAYLQADPYSSGPNMMNQQYSMNPMMNSDAMNASNQTMPASNNMDSLYSQDASMGNGYTQPKTQNPYPRENLIYDMQRDPTNANDYMKLYQQYAEIFPEDEVVDPMADMSQSSRNALASSDNAINTVDQLQALFTNAGSGSGRIGGTIKNFAANAGLDQNAKIYSSLANASVTQIAKALAGSGSGTVSDMDAKVIMAALPTLRDTPMEAAAKFAALKQRLDNAKQNTMMYGASGGATSLEDQVMQSQYGY